MHTCPDRSSLPVVIVMREASEAGHAAVVSFPLPLLLLPFLLPSPDLVVQLCLPVYFLRCLPAGRNVRELLNSVDAKMTSAPTLSNASNHSGGGDFQKAPPMPGYDSLFTLMFKLLRGPIFSGMTF